MTRPCPACGGTTLVGTRAIADKRDLDGNRLALAECATCGAMFQPSVPSAAALASQYDYMGHVTANTTLTPLLARRLGQLLDGWERFRKHGRLLEIGCGGGLLEQAASSRGWLTFGTEISTSCGALLRPRMGERLFEGALPEAPFEAGSFDVVVMMEVIEHLDDPLGYLRAAARLLRPGGALYLSTPNLHGLSARVLSTRWRVFGDEHLSYFAGPSLKRALERAGFAQITTETSGVDLALFAGLAARIRRPAGAPPAHATSTQGSSPPSRNARARAFAIDRAMNAANVLLRGFALGDTLKAIAVKGES